MTPKSINKKPAFGANHILPNLLTTGNLFFGYFSVVKSMQGQFTWAASAIFLAAIFDVLDGRVARLTQGTSAFGVQYDSLCDLVSFGVAPAILMYQFALHGLGRIGWIFCFIFLACGALRLARFNVLSAQAKTSEDFTGLPIPMAAGVVASFVAFVCHVGVDDEATKFWLVRTVYEFFAQKEVTSIALLILSPLTAFLMVSNIKYRSFKKINIKGIRPFRLLALLVVVIGFAAYEPETAGVLFFLSFALSGIVEWILGWKSLTDDDEIFASDDEHDEG